MKKDPNRFNIRFNPADPREQYAITMLQGSGRKKATLISEALYFYVMQIKALQASGANAPYQPTLPLAPLMAHGVITEGAVHAMSGQGNSEDEEGLRGTLEDVMSMFSVDK